MSTDESAQGKDLNKSRILIVEDEIDAANIFKTLIETSTKGDYLVDVANDGKRALELQSQNFYHLLLLDIIMPVMDGIEALKELKENPTVYGEPVVLMLTNLTGEMAEESVKKYKADGFIVKIDTEPEQLLTKIADALASMGEKKKEGLNKLKNSGGAKITDSSKFSSPMSRPVRLDENSKAQKPELPPLPAGK